MSSSASSQKGAKPREVNAFAAVSDENGVDSVTALYRHGSDEMKNLILNECEMIYECRLDWIASLFC